MTARVRLGALAITVVAMTAVPAAAQGAEYGSRTMREGTNGGDVKQLQRYLTQAGFETTADGAFGPLTARSVRRFERADGRPVNGVVPPRDARAIQAQASEATPEEPEPTEPTETSRARITSDGLAVAPARRPGGGQAGDRGGQRDRDEALQVRRRPRPVERLGLRLLGLGLLRAARRRPGRAARATPASS